MEHIKTARTDTSVPTEQKRNDQNNNEDPSDDNFQCNICLETAKDAVITLCGHLFCWPCLSQWLESCNAGSNKCPVCKAGISKDNVIPIYGKNCSDKVDPRTKTRPKPQSQCPQPEARGTRLRNFFGPVSAAVTFFALMVFLPLLSLLFSSFMNHIHFRRRQAQLQQQQQRDENNRNSDNAFKFFIVLGVAIFLLIYIA